MPAAEIRSRVHGLLQQQRERRAYRRRSSNETASAARREQVGREMLERTVALVPGARGSEIQRLARNADRFHSDLVQRTTTLAGKILDGTWPMLGHEFALAGEIDWHADPRTGHQFPRAFYADVPLHQEDDDDIDVKYVWELGRHQYLVELSRAWLLDGEERAAAQTRRLLLGWIEDNPLYEGVHWTSGLEVAVRAISWIWTLAALAEWKGWQEGDLDRIVASLVDHSTYLEHHFSFYSSPYNHLIGEATGLYLIARVLESLPDAARWRSRAREVLEEHGPRQFYADGFCVEQATGYHYFTLGFLSLAIVAARQEDSPLQQAEEAAQRAFRAGILFQQPNGLWPAIGDVDSARSIPVHHDDFWDFESLCSLGAVLFNDPQLKRPGSQPGEELYWLLGSGGLEQFHQLESTSPDGFTHLEESGYVLARQWGDWLCFDAGPIAHGLHADDTPSTAHGHLDTLQVLYCHNGEPVLIDPGMPFYFGDREWVRHFRGAGAHNTIEVEGLEFARAAGRLAWSNVLEPDRLEHTALNGSWLTSGQISWSKSGVVDRSVLLMPGVGVLIADWVRSDIPRRCSWNWMLPSGLMSGIKEISPTSWHALTKRGEVFVSASEGMLNCVLDAAEDNSPIGWHSDGYGHSGRSERLRSSLQQTADAIVLTGFVSEMLDVEVTNGEVGLRHSTTEPGTQYGVERAACSRMSLGGLSWNIRFGLADGPPEREPRDSEMRHGWSAELVGE